MKITFSCGIENYSRVFDPPVPAREVLPEWYKKQQPLVSEGLNEFGRYDETIKRCMPALDAMIAGYVFTIPSDIEFSFNEDGSRRTVWSVEGFKMIESHSRQQFSEMYLPPEYEPDALKMINPWIVRTPPGYSCLFTMPMWRDDLPFMICSGIVDTDSYIRPVNFPFFLRKDFSGVIQNGTPFIQIIPFKRDEWEGEVDHEISGDYHVEWQRASRKSANRYKTIWRKAKIWR